MDTKTRIQTIRLMDMLLKKPIYMETLGMEVMIKKAHVTET